MDGTAHRVIDRHVTWAITKISTRAARNPRQALETRIEELCTAGRCALEGARAVMQGGSGRVPSAACSALAPDRLTDSHCLTRTPSNGDSGHRHGPSSNPARACILALSSTNTHTLTLTIHTHLRRAPLISYSSATPCPVCRFAHPPNPGSRRHLHAIAASTIALRPSPSHPDPNRPPEGPAAFPRRSCPTSIATYGHISRGRRTCRKLARPRTSR